MSSALSRAIYARLAGIETLTGAARAAQTDLAALLATDPDTGKPCVFQSSLSEVRDADENIPYPVITFRENAGVVDRRFQEANAAVGSAYYDFEIWDSSQSGTKISDIAEAMERLLDNRRGVSPLFSLDAGRCYDMKTLLPPVRAYDKSIHVHFGLVRYEFLEAR